MEVSAAAQLKAKAVEFAEKLAKRFPTQLFFLKNAISSLDDETVFTRYVADVHAKYASRIEDKDETFFMTTTDIDDPLNMVSMVRGLWTQMGERDKRTVWKYMDTFEKIVARHVSDTPNSGAGENASA
jgi:hypothetical protein